MRCIVSKTKCIYEQRTIKGEKKQFDRIPKSKISTIVMLSTLKYVVHALIQISKKKSVKTYRSFLMHNKNCATKLN